LERWRPAGLAPLSQILMALMNKGRGDLDHSALATFIEDTAKPKFADLEEPR